MVESEASGFLLAQLECGHNKVQSSLELVQVKEPIKAKM